jgi:hypothetical protein
MVTRKSVSLLFCHTWYIRSKRDGDQRGGMGSTYKMMEVYYPNHKMYCPASAHLALSVWSHS